LPTCASASLDQANPTMPTSRDKLDFQDGIYVAVVGWVINPAFIKTERGMLG
jgi:hypothetical protein